MKNKGTNQFDFINLFQFSFPICQIQVNGLLLSIKRSCHQSLLIGRQVFQSKKWEEQSIRNLQNKRAMNSSKSQSIIHFFTLQESCHQSCAQIFLLNLLDVVTSHHAQVLLSPMTIIPSICSIYCPIISISAKVQCALHHSVILCTGELWLSLGMIYFLSSQVLSVHTFNFKSKIHICIH